MSDIQSNSSVDPSMRKFSVLDSILTRLSQTLPNDLEIVNYSKNFQNFFIHKWDVENALSIDLIRCIWYLNQNSVHFQ